METIRMILLALSVLGVFGFGYFLMTRLDQFLDENREAIERESEKKAPSRVMLTEDMSDEEIAEEVRRFREKHKSTRIVLYDSTDTDSTDRTGCHTGQKQ